MVVTPIDRMILHWAYRNGFDGEYRDAPIAGGTCIEVALGTVTVYFEEGRLVRVVNREGEGEADTDVLVEEMASVFALCGAIEVRRGESHGSPPRNRLGGNSRFGFADRGHLDDARSKLTPPSQRN